MKMAVLPGAHAWGDGGDIAIKHRASTPDRQRVRFELRIACAAPASALHAAGRDIALRAAAISGGATLFPITGIWAADAAMDLDRYRGPFEVADGIAIEITVPLVRANELYAALRAIVADVCARHSLPARWIHTDIEIHGQRIAAHFRIGTE